ncbi:MAG: Minf_1886 family protein [Planctomycetota bacterium]
MTDQIRLLAQKDGRYSPEAFRFLFEALELAIELAGKDQAQGSGRHVTGQEVLQGMRAHAERAFGPLAPHVWRSWGVHETIDWGRIVFLLVEAGLLNRQDSDTIDDFRAGFDFDEAFIQSYEPPLPPLKEEHDSA